MLRSSQIVIKTSTILGKIFNIKYPTGNAKKLTFTFFIVDRGEDLGVIGNRRKAFLKISKGKRFSYYRPPEGGRLYDMKVVEAMRFCEPIMSRKI